MSQLPLEALETFVMAWSCDRNLYQSTTAEKQCLKLQEELGELSRAILHENRAKAIDGLGDMLVVMIQIAHKYSMDLPGCLQVAFDQIKDRTGELKNGTFIKKEVPD